MRGAFLFISVVFFIFSTSIYGENFALMHNSVKEATFKDGVVLKANINKVEKLSYILVSYKFSKDSDWSKLEMEPSDGSFKISINIPSNESLMYYFIEAYDYNEKIIATFASKDKPQSVFIRGTVGNGGQTSNGNKEKNEFDTYMDELQDLYDVKVVSASKQAEPIKETPVPVTVITEDMIKNSGLKNLKDILVTFVPGITFSQDHNEVNVSMRGVYASSQQKILIMRDGHRLNNRSYSEANPDYSISIDNIKQIEILRGPASSIYGNVALTAVVNIITKSGKDVNGLISAVGWGNFGQKQISLLYGHSFDKKKEDTLNGFTLWANVYQADGEKIAISENEAAVYTPSDAEFLTGDVIVGGFKNMPSYDFGFKYIFKNFKALFSMRSSTMIEPFNAAGTSQVYDYDQYQTLDGYGPGLGTDFKHLNLGYEFKLSKNSVLNIQGYFDMSTVRVTLVANPHPDSETFYGIKWDEYDFGAVLQFIHNYKLAGNGSFLFGLQVDSMKVYDSLFLVGTGGVFNQTPFYYDVWDTYGEVLESGKETVYSSFAQIKHKMLKDKLILNIGARFDYKNRHKGDSVNDFSPRAALIYIPNDMFDVKLSFSRSFVDAPYWYRYNSLASYKGSETLKPEHLNSVQLTPSFSLFGGKLKNTFNIFYNHLTDFIFRNPAANDDPDAPKYINAGMLQSVGVEEEIAWVDKNLRVRGNLTYQYVVDYEDYSVKDEKIYNVPSITGNIIFDINPLGMAGYSAANLWFNTTLRYIGSQLSPIAATGKDSYEIDAVFLVNLGLRFEFKDIFVDGRVWNLLGQEYEAGGAVPHPYPQEGRWFFLKAGYKF